jgi:GNAT superfamily N-acetyltransferase
MDHPHLKITVLPYADIAAAGHLLTRAFAHDPVITHFLDDPARRSIAFPAFFAGVLEEILPFGTVFAGYDSDRLIGLAAWLPPEAAQPDEAALARSHQHRALVRHLFPQTSQALYEGFAAAGKLHPVEPHWYLAFVGIDPPFQGRGVARKLLSLVLKDADAKGLLCYLETPFSATHKFYQDLGFEIRSQESLFQGAPPVSTMLRRPKVSTHCQK